MQRLLVLLVALFLTACSTTSHILGKYAEPDAGTVVVGIGASQGTPYQSYAFAFRRIDQQGPSQEAGQFMYLHEN